MTQFETVTQIIIEAAKSSYPEWKTFEVKNDFPDFKASFVWDSVEALKDLRIEGLEIRNSNDLDFSVRCKP